MTDRPRFIATSLGYTGSTARAVDNLEALSEPEQRRVTEQAHKKALDDRIRRRQATAQEVQRELDFTDARSRYLRRELKRLAR